jgi:hypothetical protein
MLRKNLQRKYLSEFPYLIQFHTKHDPIFCLIRDEQDLRNSALEMLKFFVEDFQCYFHDDTVPATFVEYIVKTIGMTDMQLSNMSDDAVDKLSAGRHKSVKELIDALRTQYQGSVSANQDYDAAKEALETANWESALELLHNRNSLHYEYETFTIRSFFNVDMDSED